MAGSKSADREMDLIDRLAVMKNGQANNIVVEVTRTYPVEDKDGFPIGGFLATIAGQDCTQEALFKKFRGGTIVLQAKDRESRKFFGQQTLTFPGSPAPIARPETEHLPSDTGKGRADGNGHGTGYEMGLKLGQLESLIRELARKVEQSPTAQHKSLDPFEVQRASVDNLLRMKELFGGNGNALGLAETLALIRDSESKGEQRANKVRELAREIAQEYASKDGDGADLVEAELVRTIGKVVDRGLEGRRTRRPAGKAAPAQIPTDDPNAQAARAFAMIRDGIADSIEKYFDTLAAGIAARSIRGTRTISELLAEVDKVIDYAAGEEEEVVDTGDIATDGPGERDEPGTPDAQAPTAGDQ